MHKQNLLKANGVATADALGAAEYRDRAKERRALFGTEPTPSSVEKSVPLASKVVAPHETLDSNIGNKLLQKLGWKEGALCGRNADSAVGRSSSVNDNLRQDWERIEAIASAGNGGPRSHRGIGGV